MGTCIGYFNEYLIVDKNRDEGFSLSTISKFVTKVMSLIDEAKKNKYFPSSPRIKQIQAGWKGMIDIMKSLKEKCMFLEDKKISTFNTKITITK